MKRSVLISLAGVIAAVFVNGCSSTPPNPNVERGPHGTIAYDVSIEASDPDVRIEANGDLIGKAPLHLKIYGDKDGTFHDFGSYYYVIKAYPNTTNQYTQVRYFGTGRHGAREDRIPNRVYFDMNQQPPAQAPATTGYDQPPPVYDGPPVYYGPGPYYYGPGPRVHFYFNGPLPGPFPFSHHHHW